MQQAAIGAPEQRQRVEAPQRVTALPLLGVLKRETVGWRVPAAVAEETGGVPRAREVEIAAGLRERVPQWRSTFPVDRNLEFSGGDFPGPRVGALQGHLEVGVGGVEGNQHPQRR